MNIWIFRKIMLLSLLLSMLCACKVGPKYRNPPPVVFSDQWQTDQSDLFSSNDPLKLTDLFEDELLATYLNTLAKDNHDIRIARTKLYKAYALRDISRAKLFPMIDLEINDSGSKPAGGLLQTNGPPDANNGMGLGIPLNLKERTFFVNFDVLWELDLFGRKRHEIDSATAAIEIECASYKDVLISLMAEFARTYLTLRKSQSELELIFKEAAILKDKTESSKNRFRQGLDSELSYLQNQSAWDDLVVQIPAIEAEILHLIYNLSFLLGKPPTTLKEDLQRLAYIPTRKKEIPIGFPSSLLRRRPDIRQAERNIAKATAELGVAIADLFPKITLTGSYGYQTLHLGNTSGKGASYGYGADLLTPIFHAGALRANVRVQEWARKEAYISYEKVVYRALEESETAIARFIGSEKGLKDRKKSFEKQTFLFEHTKKIYKNGLANNIELYDSAQKTLHSEKNYIDQEIEVGINLIALYKALGGDWPCFNK